MASIICGPKNDCYLMGTSMDNAFNPPPGENIIIWMDYKMKARKQTKVKLTLTMYEARWLMDQMRHPDNDVENGGDKFEREKLFNALDRLAPLHRHD